MLSLSPAKILVFLVVALIVLGPEKLPQVARQLGAAWGDLRRLRGKLESEVRGAFPDLPPSHEVAQAVRSPLAFLDRLADEHERTRDTAEDPVTAEGEDVSSTGPPEVSVTSNGSGAGLGAGRDITAAAGSAPTEPGTFPSVPDDPSMN